MKGKQELEGLERVNMDQKQVYEEGKKLGKVFVFQVLYLREINKF